MSHQVMVPTIIEDPCLAWPVQGPEMKVEASLVDGEVRMDFYLPEGHPWFGSVMKTMRFVIGRRPDHSEIDRQVHYCIMPDDLDGLLREIAAKLGLRDSWAPRQIFHREGGDSIPPLSS